MTSQPANHEIAGYMPGRLEFETEYENEAEQIVKDMIFSEEDTPEEVGTLYNWATGHCAKIVSISSFFHNGVCVTHTKTSSFVTCRPQTHGA
jgi:hypothetical protein